jgi:hypothetical protein
MAHGDLDLETLVKALHGSEINGEIAWYYDNVWTVKIGDARNGYQAQATVLSLIEAANWLRHKAIELYPNSEFAKGFGPIRF